jgi:hypothetical protein
MLQYTPSTTIINKIKYIFKNSTMSETLSETNPTQHCAVSAMHFTTACAHVSPSITGTQEVLSFIIQGFTMKYEKYMISLHISIACKMQDSMDKSSCLVQLLLTKNK